MPIVETTLFVITLLLSAFFSGSETAYVTANRLKIRLYYREQDGASPTATLLHSDQRFLSTTLVGNNIVMVACSSLAVVVFSVFLSEAVLVLFTTMFLLLFGEILPKSIASQMPNKLLRLAVHLLTFFYFLFYPLIWLAETLSRFLVRKFNRDAEATRIFSKYDLLVLVREYASREDFATQNQRILSRAVKFRDKRLWDVMIPRTEILGVEKDEPVHAVKAAFATSGFSRLPVFDGDPDNILGVLYVLDFFSFDFEKLPPLRPPLFLPETTKVIDALKVLQSERISMAITVDEHGGTAGLVTIEDIVEKLVGSILDEFDLRKKHIKTSGDATLVMDGKTSVEDLRERYEVDIPEGDYITVAGLITDTLGRIPKPGESIDFESFKIKVLDASETKILKVWMTKKPGPDNS